MTGWRKRQVMEMALKFVEDSECGTADLEAALKEALAQPERDYERGFIDGMQKQMQSSVDKAVNAMSRNAWADKYQNEQWHKAAIRLGEELASVGPVGYYEMDASEWLDWALNQLKEKNT